MMSVDLLGEVLVSAQASQGFKVPIDVQFIIPISYFLPFFVAVLASHILHKKMATVLCLIFWVSFSALVFVSYSTEAWRYILPLIALAGIVMGLSSSIRKFLKRVKMMGDDDNWLK